MTPYREKTLIKVYDALVAYWKEHQMSPSIEELAQTLHYSSATCVCGFLKELEEQGEIEIRHGKQRCLRVVGAKWVPPAPR